MFSFFNKKQKEQLPITAPLAEQPFSVSSVRDQVNNKQGIMLSLPVSRPSYVVFNIQDWMASCGVTSIKRSNVEDSCATRIEVGKEGMDVIPIIEIYYLCKHLPNCNKPDGLVYIQDNYLKELVRCGVLDKHKLKPSQVRPYNFMRV